MLDKPAPLAREVLVKVALQAQSRAWAALPAKRVRMLPRVKGARAQPWAKGAGAKAAWEVKGAPLVGVKVKAVLREVRNP